LFLFIFLFFFFFERELFFVIKGVNYFFNFDFFLYIKRAGNKTKKKGKINKETKKDKEKVKQVKKKKKVPYIALNFFRREKIKA